MGEEGLESRKTDKKGKQSSRRLAHCCGRGCVSPLHCRRGGTGDPEAEAGGDRREEWCLSELGAALQSQGVEIESFKIS